LCGSKKGCHLRGLRYPDRYPSLGRRDRGPHASRATAGSRERREEPPGGEGDRRVQRLPLQCAFRPRKFTSRATTGPSRLGGRGPFPCSSCPRSTSSPVRGPVPTQRRAPALRACSVRREGPPQCCRPSARSSHS